MSTLRRETAETRVRVALEPGPAERGLTRGRGDGEARAEEAGPAAGAYAPAITTGDAFLDHMLVTFARYSGLSVTIDATGDLRHHLVEDVAITLGQVLGRDTPATCARYGGAVIPMDDALVQVSLDAGGRPHYEGRLPSRLYEHFFRSLALNAGWTLHIRVIRGRDRHHIVEAGFKALALAVREALRDEGTVFSTKGGIGMEWEE